MPKRLSDEKIDEIKALILDASVTMASIPQRTGVTRRTVYAVRKSLKIKGAPIPIRSTFYAKIDPFCQGIEIEQLDDDEPTDDQIAEIDQEIVKVRLERAKLDE